MTTGLERFKKRVRQNLQDGADEQHEQTETMVRIIEELEGALQKIAPQSCKCTPALAPVNCPMCVARGALVHADNIADGDV